MRHLKLPLGMSDFEEIRQNGYYYIDKSGLISDLLVRKAAKVTLITRPRRFGKTLGMSMLAHFFDIEKDSRALFEGLEISKQKELCVQWMNQYPVIFLTLKDMKNNTFEKQLTMFSYLMQEIIRNNHELLTSERINEFDKERMKSLYHGAQNEVELQNALRFISGCLEQHYQKQVIILIDE